MSNGFNGEIGKTVLHEARKPLPEELERDFDIVFRHIHHDMEGDDCPECNDAEPALTRIQRALEEALQEIEQWRRYKADIDEALNSGDGVYRP